jgi:hypothetical protein
LWRCRLRSTWRASNATGANAPPLPPPEHFVVERIRAKCRTTGLAGRYTIELFERDEGSGTEAVIDSDDRLDTARSLYSRAVMNHPNRLMMLCDRARVLARSDHPETMPI